MATIRNDGAHLLPKIGQLGASLTPGVCRAIADGLLDADENGMGAHSKSRSALIRLLPGELQGGFGELLDAWFNGAEGRTGLTFGWALRSANATALDLRRRENASLVWSGPSPALGVLRQTREALLQVIEAARNELWVVSFVGYGLPELEQALRTAADRQVRIRFVIEESEASEGRMNSSKLQNLGAKLSEVLEVFIWPADKREANARGHKGSLHAKCAVADAEHLFVSSANLTEHAMHLNMEMGLLVNGGAAPRHAAEHLQWLVDNEVLCPLD